MPVDLYDHQREALGKLRSGSILCGGVGSGKSRTALAYFMEKELASFKSLYIITTAMKRDSLEWDAELANFSLSKYDNVGRPDVSVVIDSWNNIEKYVGVSGAFFIFDEQRVVGKGKWASIFVKIAKKNRWILLSATPGDTWSDYIPVFLANGFFKNRTHFYKTHVVFSRFSKYPKIERYIYTEELEKLRSQILVEMPMKRHVLYKEHTLYSKYDSRIYQKIMTDRWNPTTNTPIIDAGEMCRLLREVVNKDSSKTDILAEILHDHHRAIIFYNFDYELEALEAFAKEHEIPYSQYNGHAHEEIPQSDKWLYLVQYNAGAEGWNCIKTNVIIFWSLNYSYKMMTQAKGRIDRLNTPFHELHYYYILSQSSIDWQIRRALHAKENFNERAFEKEIRQI